MRNTMRVVWWTLIGAVCGYCGVVLLEFLGLQFHNENAASWFAVMFGINGAIVAVFGWKYWLALGNDAADLYDGEAEENHVDDHR
jgi:hypothetical protein